MADLFATSTQLKSVVDELTKLFAAYDVTATSDVQTILLDQIDQQVSDVSVLFDGVTEAGNSMLATTPVVVNDEFQGIRFYDGTRFGYLRIKPNKVELLVSEPLEYEIDATLPHTYRVTAMGNDVKLYIDNVLAIDGTGKFTQKTDHRLIEFGDISGRNQNKGSAWKNFRYNVSGANAPGSNDNMVTEEVLSVPDGAFGSAASYGNALYASFDPADDSASSSIYRYKEGSTPEIVPAKPITKSSVNAVKIDPNKQTDVFGTSGKFIATDFGLQYVLGSKLSDLPLEADMISAPEDEGWSVLANCEGTCHNLNGGILTIDTRNESNVVYFDYRDKTSREWVSTAKNEKGWTVEAVVRITDDGTSGLPSSHDEAYFEALAATEGKDVVVAVERSSIMQPNEKKNAVRLVSYLLRQLNRWDKFNIVLYGQFDNRYPVGSPVISNLCESFSSDFVAASGNNIDLAIDFVKGIDSETAYGLCPDVRSATEKSLGMTYSSPNKYMVIVGTGFSYVGPFPPPNASLDYGTQPTDLTALSYNVIPAAVGHSVVKDTDDQNTTTYDAKIITVGLGEFLDSPGLVLPSDVAFSTASVYQTMWSKLASDSSGKSYRVKSIDDPDVVAKAISIFMDPNSNNNTSSSSSITALQAAVASGDGCAEVVDTSMGSEPSSDGIYSPGIVINDGTYQEIVQLFQRGIRLKYAKLFAPLDLSSKYYRLRIVGRKQAIAVYAKAEGDKDWQRVLFSPYGLYVKSQQISDVDNPMVVRDSFGVKHAVWQETVDSVWSIFYARTSPETVLCSGVVNDPKSEYLTDIIANRVSFGLSAVGTFDPQKITNSVVSGTGKFLASGVQVGDVISIYNFMRADGVALSRPPATYIIKSVDDDVVVSLDTTDQIYTDNLEERWDTAEYVIHRGTYKFGAKVKVSTETLDSSNPCVFVHSSGDVYVAYENTEKGSSDIYIRRANSNPTFTTWEETLRLTRGAGMSHTPSLTEVSDGKLMAAWEESSADGTRSQILYAFIDTERFTDKVPLRVIEESSIRARNPKAISAAADADDQTIRDAIVFWDDDLGGQNGNIYAAKISAKPDETYGTVIYGPSSLTTSGDNRSPSVTSSNDDYLWLTWRKVVGGKGQVWGAKVSFANLLLTEASLIAVTIGNCSRPSISQDDQENVYVCYADDRFREGRTDIFVSTYQQKPVIGAISEPPAPEPVPTPTIVHGLDAQYFNGVTLRTLALTRIDQTVNFWWGNTMPWPSTYRAPFSARWTGQVEAQFSEPYTFCTVTDDGARLWVNGVLIQNHWWKHGPVEICSTPINLVAGQKYSIVLEFFENGRGRAATQLLWKSPSTPKQIIPSSALYPLSVPVPTPVPPPAPVPPPPTPPDELATPTTGQWVSSAQFGMDIRLMPRDDHDSFDVPSIVAESGTKIPRFFVVCRASNTGSDMSILGAYVDIAPIDSDPPLTAILTCEDDEDTRYVTNLVHFLGRKTNNSYASVNTSGIHGTDPNHGFYDIDLGDKSYFLLKTENISFPKIVPEAGCLDVWFKPQWSSTDGSVRQIFGNARYDSVTPNSFSLAYVPNGFQFRIVDAGGYIRSTTISSAEFSWSTDEPIRLRAKWIPTATGMSKINSVCFKDANNGIACGAEGAIFKTTDGGVTWTKVDVHLTYDFFSVDYVNTGIAVISGEMGTILFSIDNGTSWTAIDTSIEHDLKSVCYDFTGPVVYAVSSNGEVLRTNDLITWTTIWTAPTSLLTVSTMADPLGRSILVGGTNGKIYKSTDGITFVATTVPVQSSTLGISSISKEHYSTGYTTFACGDGGLILRTDDSGDTWTQIDVEYVGLEPALYSISRVDDGINTWFSVGSDGTMVSGVGSTASVCSTSLINGTFMAVEAQFGAAPGTKVLAAGSGSAYFISDDSGVHQTYYTISSRNLTLTINGREYTQTRVGDAPFTWDPTVQFWYVADIATSGTDSDFKLYQLTVCNAPVLNERAFLRKETWTVSAYNGIAAVLAAGYMPLSLVGKRVEWGSLSSKSRTHWKYFGAYPCAAKVPQKFYAWNTQLGLAGEIVNDLATDSLGRLFIATGNGMSVMNTGEVSADIESWENRLEMPYNSTSRLVNVTNMLYNLPEGQINSVTVDEDQDIWFGTPSGLCLLPIGSISETDQVQADPLQAIIDEYQKRLTGQTSGVTSQQTTTENSNIRKYEKVTVITTANGLPSNNINVVKAVGGNIFVGTNSGLCIISKQVTTTGTVTSQTQATTTASGTTVTGTTTTTNNVTGTTSTQTSTGSTAASAAPVGTETTSTTEQQTQTTTTLNYSVKSYTVVDGLPSNRIQSIGYNPATGEVWVGTDYGCVRVQITRDKVEISQSVTVANTMSITPWQGGMLLGTNFGLLSYNSSLVESQVSSEIVGLSPIVCGDVDAQNVAWLGSALGLVELNNECGSNGGSITSSIDGLLGFDTLIDFKYYRLVSQALPVGGCEKTLVFPQVNGKRITSGYKVIPQVPMIEFETPLRSTDSVEAFVHAGFRRLPSLINTDVYPFAYLETDKLRMNLYRKRVLAGTVLVGGNMGPGSRGTPRMYTVLAQPIDPSGAPIGDNWPITSVSGPRSVEFSRPVEEGQSIYVGTSELVQTIPTDAYGAQLVAFPATDDESNLDEYATLTVAVDSIIYVAYDSKALDIPSWLREFDPVSTIQRVTDMEVYTPPGSAEKLYVSTRGSNGCLYSVLEDALACDLMAETAMDNSGPDGCITNAVMTGTDTMRLNLTANDPISGVADMKVSARGDFKDDNGNDLPWIPFAGTYEIQVPITQSTSATVVSTLTTGTYGNFYSWNGQSLATSDDPGNVYRIIPGADPELLFSTGQPKITSLITFGSFLVVGTGPNGLIFTWDGTTLKPLTVPNATRITALAAFDNLLFMGVTYVDGTGLPTAYVYTISENELNLGNYPTLFKQTLETDITGFAVFGGMLFWSSANERIHAAGTEVVESFVTLSTTTTRGHRHSFDVPAGTKLMSGLNGFTTSVDGHSHQVINGVVQVADSHSHVLNGVMSGKVFKLDPITNNVVIVHADRDYKVTTISSSSLDDQGIMFIGTYPNGKILRYIPTEEIFSRSFDTPADSVNRLKFLQDKTYAVAGNDFFVFNGFRWEFLGSTGGSDIIDILANQNEVYLLTSNSVYSVSMVTTTTTTTSTQQPAWKACAYVTFRDNLGNESDRYDADGALKSCYYVCATDQGFSGASGFSGSSSTGGTGGTTGNGTSTGAVQLVHRITEVNENALSVMSIVGPDSFFSANLVENEIGVYESEIFNGTTSFVQWSTISWDSVVPMGTSIDMQVRSASTLAAVSSATWSSAMTTPSGGTRPTYDISNQRGQFLQFKATLKCIAEGVASPELQAVFIKLRTSQAVHYYTTNFTLPQNLQRGILTYNGCKYPPTTDLVFGINAQDSTDFSDYQVIEPNKVFEALPEHQLKKLRVGIKLISDTTTVPVVDEFSLLFSLANDAIIRLNLPGMPVDPGSSIVVQGQTKSVLTDIAQGHAHTVTYDAYLDSKDQVNGQTSINAGHSHKIVSGVIQGAAGHTHDFIFE